MCIRDRYGVELFVNFFPNLFILGTASPFYAARRDKNGGEMLSSCTHVSCRCEGRQLSASEAMFNVHLDSLK